MIFLDREGFIKSMGEEEKSQYTISKYVRDTEAFLKYTEEVEISKEAVISWKKHLIDEEYLPASINSMLASVNHYLAYIGREECRAKSLRIQHRVYRSRSEELSREDYYRLLNSCYDNERLRLIMQTLASTGVRISELEYFTPAAAEAGYVRISCKNKIRVVIIPEKLKVLLLDYCDRKRIYSGSIFRTSTGRPLNRSNICSALKRQAVKAGVSTEKVYPHNFRKLFAHEFYKAYKDIAALADVLGQSSIETTRIYIMTSGTEHRKQIENLMMVM